MQFACAASGAPLARRLRIFARAAASAPAEVVLRIVGAAEGRRLNRTYRGRDDPTNVLAFSYDHRRGDIVLCHPVVAQEARAQGKTLDAHYAHLVVHGLLHLRGYCHDRPAAARRMEKLESEILARLGYRDPYALE